MSFLHNSKFLPKKQVLQLIIIKINKMKIETKYDLGDFIFLKEDRAKRERLITSILITDQYMTKYELDYKDFFFESELTKDILK